MTDQPAPFICFSGIAPTVGDTGIGQSILQALKARVNLPIRVHSVNADVFARLPQIGPDDSVHPKLPIIKAPAVRSPKFPIRLGRLLNDLRRTGGANALSPSQYAALREALLGCAAVVYQGGPNWNDRWMMPEHAMSRWLFLEVARHYGARVYHVGVSCGPFAWTFPRRLWLKHLFRQALNCHDILFVRDAFSHAALDRIGVSTRVVDSTDAAVFLRSEANSTFAAVEDRIRAAGARRRVVVCVRDFQTRYPAAIAARDGAFRALARVLDHVQANLANVFFLGTDHNSLHGKQTDAQVARQVQQLMTAGGSTLIDADVYDASALKHIYGQFDAMISMRLHPTIFALDHGVPCLLLSYDDKCDDFFSRLGLSDYVLPLARFDAESEIGLVTQMLDQPHLRGRIQASYAQLKAAHAADYEPMYQQIQQRAAMSVQSSAP